MAVSQEKISVHSLADLKNTSDDAIPTYLNSLKFTQSHTLTDTRLALGYSAFALCAACFYWDYTLGFSPTKSYTAAAVALYTVLNGALTYWIFYVEKGTIYVGTSPTGDRIQIATKTEKHIPIYQVTVTVWKKAHPNVPNVVSLRKPFTGWFDRDGRLVVLPLQQMLASNVGIVGERDPERVVVAKKKVVRIEDGKTNDEKWAALLAESSGALDGGNASGADTPSKGKKRAKKV